MSWIENIKDSLTITTGDGKVYTPLWVPSIKSFEFNVARFEFPEQDGTLVKRGRVKGAEYSIEFYFQGEDHLDQSEAFQESAKDPRFWTISHPYYNSIAVQPLGLSVDNTQYNVTRFSGTVVETITEDRPKISLNPIDSIGAAHTAMLDSIVNKFDAKPSVTDSNNSIASNKKNYKVAVKAIKLPEEATEYFNLFNTANSAFINATAFPLAAIRATQALIIAPALFSTSVKTRMQMLTEQFNNLLKIKPELGGKRASKKTFESQTVGTVGAMAVAAANPTPTDYTNRADVFQAIKIITDSYASLIIELDSIKSENGGIEGGYIPDSDVMSGLSTVVGLTVSSLFEIALGAKQERTILLEEDTNVIILAHKLYGLLPDDSTIDLIIAENNIGLNEIMQLRKGRKIVYNV